MARAAPSRDSGAITELEAGRTLHLGEYADEPTLNLSEARIILNRTLEMRARNLGTSVAALESSSEVLRKTRDYLEMFATFKELPDAQTAEAVINQYATNMELFEKSQLGSLCPTSADEAKALIPSLEKKVEDNLIDEEKLSALCKELQRVKRQAALGGA